MANKKPTKTWHDIFSLMGSNDTETAVRELRRFAAEGGDVFETMGDGDSLLHAACLNEKGGPMAVVLLEEFGVDPNKPDNGGWTPAHRCANHGSIEALEALMATGELDLKAKDRDEKTAKDWAEGNGYKAFLEVIDTPLVKSARKR